MTSTDVSHRDKALHANSTNWLRAAVLGANDGIVSIAAIVVGVAGALTDVHSIFISGVAGLLAGAFSMAAGEYISVSSQRDTEQALLAKERRELEEYPEAEFEELTKIYEEKGLTRGTAETVARELSRGDVFETHAREELNIDPSNLTNPWQASFASFISFTVGGIIPLLPITLLPASVRIEGTFVAATVALVLTGILSAAKSGASHVRVVLRIVLSGLLAMAVTYGVGVVLGATVL
ncbi:MAG TPA: VIT family protein [Candidatus Paceibacterota bacterium]|nr:VIT family protein [Candidatus Paceibacterota bacterium]